MAKPAVKKPGRDVYLKHLGEFLPALLDDELLQITSAEVKMVQHAGPEQFYCYINIKFGEISELRYDRLREVVNGLGGQVVIPSPDRIDNEGANVRVWMR